MALLKETNANKPEGQSNTKTNDRQTVRGSFYNILLFLLWLLLGWNANLQPRGQCKKKNSVCGLLWEIQ